MRQPPVPLAVDGEHTRFPCVTALLASTLFGPTLRPERKGKGKDGGQAQQSTVRANRVLTRRADTHGNLVCTPSTASGTGGNLTVMINSQEDPQEKHWRLWCPRTARSKGVPVHKCCSPTGEDIDELRVGDVHTSRLGVTLRVSLLLEGSASSAALPTGGWLAALTARERSLRSSCERGPVSCQ